MKLGHLSLSITSPAPQIMLMGSSSPVSPPPKRKGNLNLYCFMSDLEDIKPILI